MNKVMDSNCDVQWTKFRHRDKTRVFYRKKVVTSWSITWFWIFLSIFLAILSTYSFLQSDWVIKRNLIVTNFFSSSIDRNNYLNNFQMDKGDYLSDMSIPRFMTNNVKRTNYLTKSVQRRVTKVTEVKFGVLGLCVLGNSGNSEPKCYLYKDSDRYSNLWPVCLVLGGSGCVTLCVCAMLSILGGTLPSSTLRNQMTNAIGQAQTVAVVLLFSAILVYPIGFGSHFMRDQCGSEAGIFKLGDCEIGWAFALLLVSASLSLYCPLLVKFTSDITYTPLPKYI